MKFEEYRAQDALGLARLIAGQQVSAAELLECAIARAEAVNPKLNAIVRPLYALGRERARQSLNGPLAGVPFLLKDLMADLAGEPTSGGSRFFADYVPEQDSELVARYKKAGLVIFGKTNTPELGLTPFTEPELFGPAHNPWNLDYTPGGSSGGSGAAIAAGIVPAANGGDGGGSIRIPAACCGLVGLKPTRGRIPTGPLRGDFWYGSATEHVLTRSVRDTAALLDATEGADAGSPYFTAPPAQPFLKQLKQETPKLRIAFSAKPMLGLKMDPACIDGLQRSVQLLQDLGHELEEDAPPVDRESFLLAFAQQIAGETAAEYRAACQVLGKRFDPRQVEPFTMAQIRVGRALSAEALGVARRILALATRQIGQFFEKYDVLLTPTLGMRPFKIGALQPQGLDAFKLQLINKLPLGTLGKRPTEMLTLAEKIFEWIPNTPVFNVTGQPSISLPLHQSEEGLPIGMMFTARFGDDATLLKLSAQLEQAQPWFARVPEL
ncbi:MAG: amidase [Panacagrimonas sp.]